MDNAAEVVVVKVGGSLYDLPDLGTRLHRWLDQLGTARVIVLPGGGVTADAVRQLDRWQQVGEEAAHWLALEAVALNARFLAHVLPSAEVVQGLLACPVLWGEGKVPVLDAMAFGRSEETLPHTWQVTSDSIAARLAVVAQARRLILLKSAPIPAEIDWQEAGRRGLVDAYFGQALAGSAVEVEAINFRSWQE